MAPAVGTPEDDMDENSESLSHATENLSISGEVEDSNTSVSTEVTADAGQILAEEMRQKAAQLLQELQLFEAHLKGIKRDSQVFISTFKGEVVAEKRHLEKVIKTSASDEKLLHALRSSNFTFYCAMWSIAKTCSGITGLRRWYPLHSKDDILLPNRVKQRSNSAMVDIIAQNNLEWVKVSSITEKRILWDLAKAGYAADSGSESDEEFDDSEGLLKQVSQLRKASLIARVRYRHPSVRLVLPRITRDSPKQVLQVIEQIRAMGITVELAEEVSKPPSIADVIQNMSADRFASFSDVLNIDCTILLAFASDLSHGRVEPEHWHNKDIQRQLKVESGDPLLPRTLWPACGSRKLVCTREAAVRMQGIVDIIGTDTEKLRTALLIDADEKSDLSHEERVAEIQKLSDYEVPKGWKLPVRIIDVDVVDMISQLPPVAEKVSGELIDINKSVFFYSWLSGRTTISSNGTVAKAIEHVVEENRTSDTDTGPDIWCCGTSRSLVGKEKERRGNGESVSTPNTKARNNLA